MQPLVFSYHGRNSLYQEYSQADFDTTSNRTSLMHGPPYTPKVVVLISTYMRPLWGSPLIYATVVLKTSCNANKLVENDYGKGGY